MNKRILIIDDEPDIRELIGMTLRKMGLDVEAREDVAGALQALASKKFDLCLSDMKLPDGNGMDIVKHIQEKHPQLPVAIITAHGSMDTAVEALKLGAFDFISKPIELKRLRNIISAALQLDGDNEQALQLTPQLSSGLTGSSPSIERLKQQIIKVARSQAPIFISGESGSGKELVARAIHYTGPRSSGPFIPVNCGAIPDDLMESEFFGHTKGSFTGASSSKQGLFQAADGGTLFLDEVADLPLHMQVKLLRAIQERAIRPVGATQETPVNIRVLSATHKHLKDEVSAKTFRKDLFYRINVIQIDVPALRERPEDIKSLSGGVLDKLSKELNLPPPSISKAALQALECYSFPGNVRELENILERALTLCDGNTIQVDDLNLPLFNNESAAGSQNETEQEYPEGYQSVDHYLEEVEKNILIRALEKNKWNKTATAKTLGISFRQIRYKLKKLGLDE